MNKFLLMGKIYLTKDIKVINDTPLDVTKIINLDEEGYLQDNNSTILGGRCLLPPIEAKIAEVDGNEVTYDNIYKSHLLEEFQQDFITALIAYLYKGGQLMLFLPDDYNTTIEKLIQHMWILYGIHIGFIESPNINERLCFYDEKCIPIWMNMLYMASVLYPSDYLRLLPPEVPININNMVLNKLIIELNPYGETINEKIKSLTEYRQKLFINPSTILAITSA